MVANRLRQLEVVAFPTETVYGIGAVAFSPIAVGKVFLAKKRPINNPLLIHISDIEQVSRIICDIPEQAGLLMKAFWPGPLSIILKATDKLPVEVTAGGKGVGLRMPSHPVARALIRKAGPVAATSANLSGRPSPISVEHIKKDLDGKISAVLDAGNTGLGLESTIIDFTGKCCQVLRRGGVQVKDLEAVLGTKLNVTARQQHFDLNVQIIISSSRQDFERLTDKILDEGKKMAIVSTEPGKSVYRVKYYKLDFNPEGKVNLYSILRDAEEEGIEVLLFTPLSENINEAGLAILDRIRTLPKL